MYRQVGPLQLDEEGIARRGLLIRHLVMPEDISGTREVLRWIAEELGPDTPISLMDQYFPAWKAVNDPVLNRRLSWTEYRSALDVLDEFNFTAGYVQEDLIEIDTTSNT
jgi:putative pyruvate formate lyase activating enzyme